MDSHIFKKATKSKNKMVHRWYYYYNDVVTGKKIQRVCKGCKTQAEAYAYISALPPLYESNKITIQKIAQWMYVPGSDHIIRQEKLGKTHNLKTLQHKRHLLEIFLEKFGDLELKNLTIPMVMDYLMSDNHSGSWKNNLLTIIGEVYGEAPFYGVPYQVTPVFPKFARNSRKKDIFTTEELHKLFNEQLWITLNTQMYEKQPQYDEGYKAIYLLFLTSMNCGLRLGESIGLKVKQFLFDEKMLIVDGFYRYQEKERTNFNKCGSESNQKIRVVPLSDKLAQIIQSYICEKDLAADDYVFSRYGKPIRKHLAEKWFQRAIALSGIKVGERRLTPHSLRYTYVTRMRRNLTGETVQKLVGHTSIAMTDHYTHSAIPELCKAIEPARDAVNFLFE